MNKLVNKDGALYVRMFGAENKVLADVKVLKGFESFNGWYWFVTEERVEGREIIYFGFVQGFEEEWGYFSQIELDELGPKVWRIKEVDLPYSGRRD